MIVGICTLGMCVSALTRQGRTPEQRQEAATNERIRAALERQEQRVRAEAPAAIRETNAATSASTQLLAAGRFTEAFDRAEAAAESLRAYEGRTPPIPGVSAATAAAREAREVARPFRDAVFNIREADRELASANTDLAAHDAALARIEAALRSVPPQVQQRLSSEIQPRLQTIEAHRATLRPRIDAALRAQERERQRAERVAAREAAERERQAARERERATATTIVPYGGRDWGGGYYPRRRHRRRWWR